MAQAIAIGALTARESIGAALAAIANADGHINAFTTVLREQALADADAIDTAQARGAVLPPLAGVPFAAKNLFDIAGITTLAGSKINRELAPASTDATAVARLRAAGAILVGATNMDEYAFGFTTRNTHYGPTRNPHDPACIAGGSSGGSAAAVAAGMVPLALGTDTGGSVRVPAALCGIYGIKPTFGRVSRRGVFPFSSSMDHVGAFARSVADLALAYDLLQGPDAADPAASTRAAQPVGQLIDTGIEGFRFARAGGYFEKNIGPQTRAAVGAVAAAIGVTTTVTFAQTELARAAAFLLSPAEGAQLHRANLTRRAHDFDPVIRDRLLAGLITPAAWLSPLVPRTGVAGVAGARCGDRRGYAVAGVPDRCRDHHAQRRDHCRRPEYRHADAAVFLHRRAGAGGAGAAARIAAGGRAVDRRAVARRSLVSRRRPAGVAGRDLVHFIACCSRRPLRKR